MLLNFHTHHPRPGERYVRSLGLHPWHLNAETLRQEMEGLKKQLLAKGDMTNAGKNYDMIGECGLDKACATPFSLQKEAFRLQLELAEELQMPVVVHCVKAYNELFQMRIESAWKQPWVLHGYTGSPQMTRQLRNAGLFFSFGRQLHQRKVQESLAFLAMEAGTGPYSFFLETDDDVLTTIEEVYNQAAHLLNLPRLHLEEAIQASYERLTKGNMPPPAYPAFRKLHTDTCSETETS
ncbi:MAG: TatD family hydrolase [Bacteroidales bacterium]|nr:TatD family hydrolase [Bacteroidales bacterium]